ncbi:hypothetical protein ACPPVV_09460 [Rhodanobacter sp. Col0626]|uniref:hypothetical protein n=1 Tax=Rhodanobacter sp. Col0626 TaxID=3415679 RepID=UPI003CEBABE6
MDELRGTRAHAERQRSDAPVTQSQFGGLIKKVSAELNTLRSEVTSLRRRVEQLTPKGEKP